MARKSAIVPIILGVAGFGAVGVALAAASSGGGGGSAPQPIAKPSGKATPEQAANLLLLYLEAPGVDWGSKKAPNKTIAGAQADMGSLIADGIYGPKTKARGEALTKKPWPAPPAAAKPAAKKPTAAAPSALAKAKPAATTIPSNKVAVTLGKPISVSPSQPSAAASSKPPSAVMTAQSAAPRPTPPPGGSSSSTSQVVPTERSPKAAAQDLYTYAQQLIRQGRGAELGSKDKPNNTVAAAQRDMRKIASDGIYGPKTQARGKELIAMEFPSRYGTGTKVSSKPPVPPLTTATEQENRERAAEGLLAYLSKPGADQGAKGKPSAFVKASQQQMGGLTADGIYGPATRARGSQLINKPFPPRK